MLSESLSDSIPTRWLKARASVVTPQSLKERIRALPSGVPRLSRVLWDSTAWLIAFWLFISVRYDFQLSDAQWDGTLVYICIVILLQVTLGFITQVYLGRSRLGSFAEITWMASLVVLVGASVGLVMAFTVPGFPRGIGLLVPPLALTIMAGGRGVFRALLTTRQRTHDRDNTHVLVYGAGDLGHQVAYLVDVATAPPYNIVGFIDDAASKRFLRVGPHRVLGTGDQMVEIARARGASAIVLAISDASPALFQQVSARTQAAGLDLIVVPPIREMIGGRITLASLRDFNVGDLLGRRPIETDLSRISGYVTGKAVLITGAGGSIGSELARQVHKLGPSRLILLDRDESGLHSVQLSIYGNGLLDTEDIVLCDIRDRVALQRVFTHHRPEVVFHAAALKHLPMLERYPDEGWKTNVLGSLNVLLCAQRTGVEHLVNISTDKAADASSVLGRTKRLAERLTAWYATEFGLRYLSVRFGNVLGSRGSVLFAFRAQIEQGGPVTVTHPDVMRFFMTIPEACELVLQAGAIGNAGDVLVLDMGEPVRIVDIAKRLIAESDKDIDIHYTGLRPGEKLHEVLFSDGEKSSRSGHDLISQVAVPPVSPAEIPGSGLTHEHSTHAPAPRADAEGRLPDTTELEEVARS